MSARFELSLTLLRTCLLAYLVANPVEACCPAPPSGKPVVNADQTVIILWDAANRMQHFIRQASFKSAAEDFGFLIPSPSEPELDESGDAAFPYLRKLTEPVVQWKTQTVPNVGIGCSAERSGAIDQLSRQAVTVLQEKLVAGFHAVVLDAASTDSLTEWLKEHAYAYSPQIEAWAKPYVDGGWKITALKVAKPADSAHKQTVATSSLRISFQTDRPLFPYREPDPVDQADALGARHRLLRIYFLGEARYAGRLIPEYPWTGNIAWSDKLQSQDREEVLQLLRLPTTSGPNEWWLTEFEDYWPYTVAPADVYFSRDVDQSIVNRPPIIEYEFTPWPALLFVAAVLAVPISVRRLWRQRCRALKSQV